MTTGRVSKRHRKCVDDDVVVGDVVAVVGVGDGVNPMRNGPRKSHKNFYEFLILEKQRATRALF